MKTKLIEFPQMGDARGNLVVIEGKKEIPFDIKRIFYIYGADPSAVRGQHANRNSEFVLININGSSKVRVKDGKGNEEVFILDRPYIGLYIPKMLWKDMYNFSHDAILLVLASEYYDAGEYIRNYEDFEKEVNGYE
ncbi:MAG TPA: FdtA/QdtA family cupin domain-containing protein [Clostridiales bacterium]|jgi:dTDP-4-dehydrorhamnose 3,5-epimerase-like enzyme|nr:FdtA/QdtA family cupin domain-containing protein [Clostridiales bacterium]HOL92630.1 FdtA/QdtA family cupin domain-containing protein [Clostridiales bacterium]HQD32133.1 FdtA/QdtA family cupin domain-containing protein [Clostridiales bacterium]